jgi:hypothetical protein
MPLNSIKPKQPNGAQQLEQLYHFWKQRKLMV